MSKVGRQSWVDKEPTTIGASDHYREQVALNSRIRSQNKRIDKKAAERKEQWSFQPPDNVHLSLVCECGVVPTGIVVSVCQRVGALLLHRKLARIHASPDVVPDVILTGSYEDVVEQMGLVPKLLGVSE